MTITHPDKIFWPRDGYTKADLLRYYQAAAPVLLPHLRDRPLNLHRFPDGIAGKEFFQKDVARLHLPPFMKTHPVRSESERRTLTYALCENRETLEFLVNLGCIEMNPWNSRRKTLDRPDYLVMDLDPEGVPFHAVVETALALKGVMDLAGIIGIPKTSGARGLHVFVPLGARYSYREAARFAEILALLVQERLPTLASLARSPRRRRGRVYLDVPQNRFGASTVAAYSVRPRPGATVSAPLRWSEVRAGLDPTAFTIKTMPRRIARVGDLWKPVRGRGVDLRRALNRLERSLL